MGQLVNGVWHDVWYDTKSNKGEFVREQAQLRHWITADGRPGPTGEGGFKAEKGRYHLYVSYACPWAHRTLIFLALKGLQDYIDVSVVSPDMLDKGWTFDKASGSSGDKLHGFDYHYQVYTANQPDYSGRVTVPVLWDTHTRRIVNNESSEIIRMLNSAFDHLTGNTDDYWPEALRDEIEAVNQEVYDNVNNGVYRAGFATTQDAYEAAYDRLFAALDRLEARLATRRYLLGSRITEADWRLFTTLVRFDAVYFGHFKCNRQLLASFPNLSGYVRELYQWPGIANTVNMDHIKRHYYYSHDMINPTRVVPKGPEQDFLAPHGREHL
ncbi:glutathione S-transferase family protein [Ferrimonas balearica]|uniref:glutathione S-transferase family protein n=1 Tax=Ferrimonas balearica TaxID=44012 RepID=UPI001F240502|nr:glutathione S-transferase family protein [Ferrimonas balearica]MBY6019232.1 glutathione S-transferase family protein [Halomonas denitrificans]MBY6095835.1 glutathione S-transferase family protein [Ferrimonas balearica]